MLKSVGPAAGAMKVRQIAVRRRDHGLRPEVHDTTGRWLATFTNGAYTVVLWGPRRRFVEGKASLSHAKWVRTYPTPFAGKLSRKWLERALAANQARAPDVLAIAVQYIRGAPAILERGLQIAGDAPYGPGTKDDRREGSDFNDYLGVTWTYPDEPADSPEFETNPLP